MCNMFKYHILVAEALSRNPEECWVASQRNAGKYLCNMFGEVSELQAKLSETSVHAPFCIGVNELLPFPV